MNYKELGFKAGLEVHVQLINPSKLYCRCPAELEKEDPRVEVIRRFRPVMGEMGEFDKALLLEFEKKHVIHYSVHDHLCTYELDETPPFELDNTAVKTAILIARLFRCHVVDEIHVCRKNYLDGSVTAGFQRTALLGYQGLLPLPTKNVRITWLYLEEDAGRKDNERTKGKHVAFKLDRLGIPLVEIVTAPDCETPDELREAAKRLGMLLKASKLARRGLGAIRQDLNISIAGGRRVELKGVSLLDLIPVAANMEIKRQQALIEVQREMKQRGIKPDEITFEPRNVTSIFEKTSSKLLRKALKRREQVWAMRVPKMTGLLGKEVQPNRRFGTEIADRVKAFTSLKGIIHSDENLKKYGFSDTELAALVDLLKVNPEEDAFILVTGSETDCRKALSIARERIIMALDGVPEETRRVSQDGTSSFMRDLHGRSRLYPDTDSPYYPVDPKWIQEVDEKLPPYPWEQIDELARQFGLTIAMVEELVYEGRKELFDHIVAQGHPATLVASTLTQQLSALRREGAPIDHLTDGHFIEVFTALKQGKFSKEAIFDVLKVLSEHPDKPIDAIVKELGLGRVTEEEVIAIIDQVIEERRDFILKNPDRALKPLMGPVMKEVRGKMDGKKVNQLLRDRLQQFLENNA